MDSGDDRSSTAGMGSYSTLIQSPASTLIDGKWRRRFVERGIDGLLDEPRPGVPHKIDDAKVERVIVQTLESQPPAATH